MTVGIVTDSACDLPQALADDLGIRIVPLTVRFGGDELVDRLDLTPAEFWARCAASPVLPETAAPAPGQFEQAYRSLAEAGADSIVVVSLSQLLSGAMQSAQLAARTFAGKLTVEVVDSRSASTGQGMIAVAAARRARDGGGLDEVAALARDLAEPHPCVGRPRRPGPPPAGRPDRGRQGAAGLGAGHQAHHRDPRRPGRGGRPPAHADEGDAQPGRPGRGRRSARGAGRAPRRDSRTWTTSWPSSRRSPPGR